MRALDRKLWRELWHLRGQAPAIGAVVAGGLATLIMSLSTLDSLTTTRDRFYSEQRFADLFVSLHRAPETLRPLVEAIPGVQQVESRIALGASLEVAGFDDPIAALLLSIPDGGKAELNRLWLREGRLPQAHRDHETVVSEAFAEAHGLRPGDALSAIINGRQRQLDVVGIALSPEYIYQLRPGELFPDFERFGILWMNRSTLAAAGDLDGAFNDLTLSLRHDARSRDVIEQIDRLLERYGGRGAIHRDDQLSHRYLEVEFEQLGHMATMFPAIFLAVAAFLLHIVMHRLIATQRDQIAILKAFGYSNRSIGVHYLQLVLLILLVGIVLGTLLGFWLGQQMAELYRLFFRFPWIEYRLHPQVFGLGVAVTVAAGLAGSIGALRHAMRLPPAEAMRPEPQPRYRATLVERLGLQRHVSQPTRMILRSIERRPLKALLTVLGIAMACGILMIGRYQEGAIAYMIQVQFGQAQRDDLSITFVEETARNALHELQALDGVWHAEPFRISDAVLHHGHRSYRSGVQGIPAAASLRRLLDDRLRTFDLPAEGIVLNDYLAGTLHASPGDLLRIVFRDGRREEREVAVAGIVNEFTGVSAYMEIDALNRLRGDGELISGVWLGIDRAERAAIIEHLRKAPGVATISDRQTAVENFYDSMAEVVLVFAFISTLLASSIAIGVVYNAARIALTERARELASLRVLGFPRGEVRYILLGELGLLTVIAIPVGFLIGTGLIHVMISSIDSDLYRIPLFIEPRAYTFAAVMTTIAALLSGLLVARHLNRLDLVEVLKTRE